MKVITVAASKGGSGKTSTVALLAAKATIEGEHVCMLDLNHDQANLAQWHAVRGQMLPHLIQDIENVVRDVQIIRATGKFDWMIIDTPPLDMDVIETAVMVADCVVVPVRASMFDIEAVRPIVEMCNERRKPFAFLRSAFDTHFKRLNSASHNDLLKMGNVLSTTISYRLPYINALTMGKTGAEISKDLMPEADALWVEVKRLANSSTAQSLKTKVANG